MTTMEKRKTVTEMSDSEKLNYLIEKVERIDRTINPSLGRRVLAWGLTHWVIVISLISILSLLVSVWDELQVVLSLIQGIEENINHLQQGASHLGNQFGNAKETLWEGGKKIFDFWR